MRVSDLCDQLVEVVDAAIPDALLALVANDRHQLDSTVSGTTRSAVEAALRGLDDSEVEALLFENLGAYLDAPARGGGYEWQRRLYGPEPRSGNPTMRAQFYGLLEHVLRSEITTHIYERAHEFQPAEQSERSER